MLFYIGTRHRCSKTLEEQARKRVIEATQNPNPKIRFMIGVRHRCTKTLEQQVRKMIDLNTLP